MCQFVGEVGLSGNEQWEAVKRLQKNAQKNISMDSDHPEENSQWDSLTRKVTNRARLGPAVRMIVFKAWNCDDVHQTSDDQIDG